MSAVTAYGSQMDRLRDATGRIAERLWAALPYYTEDAVPLWFERIEPVIRGAQTAAVTTHDAYLAAMLGDDVVGIDPAAAIARGSEAPFTTIYRTPFLRTWKHVADGYPFREAVSAGGQLAGARAVEDVTRASLGANAIGLEHRPQIQAYRRVVRGSDTCRFCYEAAGRTYSRSDLMKLHPHCKCIVAPIEGRAYVKTQAERKVDRIDRNGRPVSKPTANDEIARKKEASAASRARNQGTADPVDLRDQTVR